jgi:diguanylate cyclase (GGDEF)-like protein
MIPSLIVAVGLLMAGWFAHGALLQHRLHTARRDPVTGLPTRGAWTVRAHRILRRGHLVALVDLDRFKEINDTFGHAAGDHVLAVTAARLRAWLHGAGGGECGRLGGDEFALAARQPITGSQLDDLVAALATSVRLPSGQDALPGASVGATQCGQGRSGLSAAMAAADAAMYAAKRAGGGWRVAKTLAERDIAARGRTFPRHRARHHGPSLGDPVAFRPNAKVWGNQ